MKKYRIMVVDDQKLIREFLARLLRLENEYEVVGDTGEGEKAVALAQELRPDLVLLDVRMVPPEGFGVLKQIRKYAPGARVIVVSVHAQPAQARAMVRAGASGYITKNSGSEEFMHAIREVLEGKTYICEAVKTIIAEGLMNKEPRTDLQGLSQRELEIIGYLRKGLSSRQIGATLFINPKTVEVHRHNILKKLQVKNTAALIQYLNERGL